MSGGFYDLLPKKLKVERMRKEVSTDVISLEHH